jgi:hypothetical protein
VAAFDVYVDMQLRVRFRVYAGTPSDAEDAAEELAENMELEDGEIIERDIMRGWADIVENEDDEENA